MLVDKANLRVKLSDFGLATRINERRLHTLCGTPQYIAPEVYLNQSESNGYSKEVDLWSAGVLLYFISSGNMPFCEDSDHSIKNKVISCDYEFPEENWNGKSKSLKSYITQFLCRDPADRISIEDALLHPWILKELSEDDDCIEIDEIRFMGRSSLKRDCIDLTMDDLSQPPLKRRKLQKYS